MRRFINFAILILVEIIVVCFTTLTEKKEEPQTVAIKSHNISTVVFSLDALSPIPLSVIEN